MPNEQAIASALADLQIGRYTSIRAAAAAYALDYSTLARRRRGGLSIATAKQPAQKLTPEQENLLVQWLKISEQAGHAFTLAALKEMASLVSRSSGGPGLIGKGWVLRFLRRHPEIKTKKGRSIANERVENFYQHVFIEWFTTLRELLDRYAIPASRIYNMDETGTALGPQYNQTIIGDSDTNSSYVIQQISREWVTSIEVIHAEAKVRIKPLIIFKGKAVQQQWFLPDQIEDWYYTASTNAFTSNDIGLWWLQNTFIPALPIRPTGEYILLLLDGHRSHTTTEFQWECFNHEIIPYYLVPHASHILQPLDLTIFSSLKRTYRKAIQLDDHDHIPPVKKQRFIQYYAKARKNAFSRENIKAGFKSAGIIPWEPQKVLRSRFLINPEPTEAITRQRTPDITPQRSTTIFNTPRSDRDLRSSVHQLSTVTPLNRTVREAFHSVGRALSRAYFENAMLQKELSTRTKELTKYRAKGKKKKVVDPNNQFATLVSIQTALTAAPATATGTATAPIVIDDQSEATGQQGTGQDHSSSFQAITARLRGIKSE